MGVSGQVTERSWRGGITNDAYMGIKNSFQYAENLNVFDDLRGIKLATKVQQKDKMNRLFKSFGEMGCVAVPVMGGDVTYFQNDTRGDSEIVLKHFTPAGKVESIELFQDMIYASVWVNGEAAGGLWEIDIKGGAEPHVLPIQDQEGIVWIGRVNVIKNFNNTLLLIGQGRMLRTYGVLPNVTDPQGNPVMGFTLIKEFEAGVEIVGISPGREYVKIFTVDEGFYSKIQYLQGSFDMQDSGVINCIELSNQEIIRVYPFWTTDYYINHVKTGNVNNIANAVHLKKIVGYDDFTILKMHAGLDPKDIENKLWYFIWPTSYQFAFYGDKIYIADQFGIREFEKDSPLERWVLKWRLNATNHIPYGLEFHDGYLYASYDHAEFRVRVFDSGVDGYQNSGFLISRVLESEFGAGFTKEIKEVIAQFELNPFTTENGKIEIFIAFNREWKDVGSDPTQNGRRKVGEIVQKDFPKMNKLRYITSPDKYGGDWDVIEYLIKITLGNDTHTTPIFRWINLNYNVVNRTVR